MVSFSGAQQAQPLVTQIAQIEASIAALQGALAAAPTIWKMAADVYVTMAPGQAPVSQSLALEYTLPTADTTSILNAVLVGLQNELAALNSQLAGIS